MTGKNKFRSFALPALAGLGICGLITLSGCSSNSSSSQDSFSTESAQAGTGVGSAPVQASPANVPLADGAVPAGQLLTQPAALTSPSGSGLIATAGDVLVARTANSLIIGNTTLPVDSSCGELNATGDNFVLPCSDGVYIIDAKNPNLDNKVAIDGGATTATMTTSGDIIAGRSDNGQITIVHKGGATKSFSAGKHVDQLISIPSPNAGEADGVYFTDHSDTTLHQVDWTKDEDGVILRVLTAVGRIAPGGSNAFLATDAGTNQIYIYTGLPIMINHQYAVTGATPWSVVWDSTHNVAWVSITGENTLEAYDFSSGTPQKVATLPAIANARSLAMDNSGNLYVAAENSNQIQMLSSAELGSAIS